MAITVTPTVELSNVPPRVRLNVTASAGETSTTVTRLDPDGRIYPVRTDDGDPLLISAGTGLVYDYEAPFGAPVTYSSLESPGTVSAEVTVAVGDVWLIHPGVPALSRAVELRAGSFDEEAYPVSQGLHYVLGREFPVVQTDGQRKGARSSLTVAVESLADLAALRALVADASVLLLNVPVGLKLGVAPCYIAVGEIRIARVSTIGSDPLRAMQMPYIVVDRPEGGTHAARTWGDVVADNATWSTVVARYATWADLLAGP